MCLCTHEMDEHASGKGYRYTYCKIDGCDCEGFEAKEETAEELDFEED